LVGAQRSGAQGDRGRYREIQRDTSRYIEIEGYMRGAAHSEPAHAARRKAGVHCGGRASGCSAALPPPAAENCSAAHLVGVRVRVRVRARVRVRNRVRVRVRVRVRGSAGHHALPASSPHCSRTTPSVSICAPSQALLALKRRAARARSMR